MPIRWNESLDRTLLLSIITQLQPSAAKIDWDSVCSRVSQSLTNENDRLTAVAVEQRFIRMRRTENDAGPGAGGGATTPKKKTGTAGTPKKATPKKKKSIPATHDSSDEDDDRGKSMTPSKNKSTLAADESSDEDGVGYGGSPSKKQRTQPPVTNPSDNTNIKSERIDW